MDIVHFTPDPQATAVIAVVVVGDNIVGYGDIGAHTQVEIGYHGILHITFRIVYIHEVGMIDFHGMTCLSFPPDAFVLLEFESEVADGYRDGALQCAGDAEVSIIGKCLKTGLVSSLVQPDSGPATTLARYDGMALDPDGTADGIHTLTEINHYGIVAGCPTALFTQLPGQVTAGVFYIDVDSAGLPRHHCHACQHYQTSVFQELFHRDSNFIG